MDEESVARYVFGKFFEKEHIVGKAEGKNEEKSETITVMLQDHEPVEKIMKYTRTTKDTIIGIADSMGIQLAG